MSNPYSPQDGPEGQGNPGGYGPGPDPYNTGGQQPGYGQQQPGYGQQQPGYGPAPGSASDDNTFAMLTHVLGIITGFVGPLILFLIKKDEASPYLRHHLLQSLNFQILVTIAYVVSWILTFVFIGLLTWMAAGICALIFGILAAVAANKGEWYKYPINVQLIK